MRFTIQECSVILNMTVCVQQFHCNFTETGYCEEKLCISSLPWVNSGNGLRDPMTKIVDFKWSHEDLCPARPFRNISSLIQLKTSTVGNVGEFTNSFSEFNTTTNVNMPFSIDVDQLTDDEIISTCLTVAQCRFPPALELVRVKSTRLPWYPMINEFRVSKADPGWNTNQRMYPVLYNRIARDVVTVKNNSFYPRSANASSALILRVDFQLNGKDLYFYQDLTCGLADHYERRNGYMGRFGGYFKETVYQTARLSSSAINTHNNLRADIVGFSERRTDYGDKKPRKLENTFVFKGFVNIGSKQFNWVSLHHTWTKVSPISKAESVPVFLDAGLKWASLSSPTGNIPMAATYIQQAYLILSVNRNLVIDDTAALAYGGDTYTSAKPSIDYLLKQPLEVLKSAYDCFRTIPSKLRNLRPPELMCQGKSGIPCPEWRPPGCQNFSNLMYMSLSFQMNTSLIELPRCIDCPGLIGVVRNNVPLSNRYAYNMTQFPQCIPHRLQDGTLIETAQQLYNLNHF